MRAARVVACLGLVVLTGAPAALAGPAAAQPRPTQAAVGEHQPYPGVPAVVPAARPPGVVAPDPTLRPVRTTDACTTTTTTSPQAGASVPWGQQQLGFTGVWELSDAQGRPLRGAGQTVAVIDTGVSPHARLPRLTGAGDAVGTTTGLEDCDAHGTLVAGILAAAPEPGGGFAGVAPDVDLLSIRQSSVKFVVTRGEERSAAGDVASLAQAVVRAADAGATVINISEAACGPAGTSLGDGVLGAAVAYAARVRDAVVVAAAGNVDPSTACGTQNALAVDPQGVTAVSTVASPAWYDDDVLTVGSVEQDGSPSAFSLAGPWVDVAAPGSGIVTLDVAPGSTDVATDLVGETSDGRTVPIVGTSFATPYVAGTVALVRQRYPELTAREVIDRLTATAHQPGGGWNPQVGYGLVDPVAAVTAPAPGDVATLPQAAASQQLEALPAPPAPDTRPRTVALVGSAAAVGALGVAAAALHAWRRRTPRP